MRESRLLLSDILQAAEDIRNFTHGVSREVFVADEKTRSAVLYKFAVMGEATNFCRMMSGHNIRISRGAVSQVCGTK
jgi:uncharacterized protein with HEPN domain